MENELNSEKSFNIVDVGSDNDTLEKVVNYLSCPQNIYCINPNKKDLDNLEIYYKKYNKVNIKKLNYAVSEFSGKINFYVTKDDTASSIYEPNQEILTRYRKDNIFDITELNVFFQSTVKQKSVEWCPKWHRRGWLPLGTTT